MIQTVDPIHDPRWEELVLRHPGSSVFHTPQWLDALRRTYGFVPVAFTTDGSGAALSGGIPFCQVDSWLTGRRLVSLPFSDHCQPLVESGGELEAYLDELQRLAPQRRWRYVQLRPLAPEPLGSLDGSAFRHEDPQYHYRLDLRADLDTLFRRLGTVLRYDVRRAERSGLRYAVGRDSEMVAAYFRLHVMTRSKQGVPPQPLAWFRNLAACLGEMLEVHLLLQDDRPIAGLVTIRFRDEFMWKYSASDPMRNGAGLGKSLMWKSICHAKEQGATTLDMGRCDRSNVGLAQFKERWGAVATDLHYLRFPAPSSKPSGSSRWMSVASRSIVPRLPAAMLAAAGRVAYRHAG
jgi:CelD/BcsL family acetyltransferase involved in cellulose biosynthesis